MIIFCRDSCGLVPSCFSAPFRSQQPPVPLLMISRGTFCLQALPGRTRPVQLPPTMFQSEMPCCTCHFSARNTAGDPSVPETGAPLQGPPRCPARSGRGCISSRGSCALALPQARGPAARSRTVACLLRDAREPPSPPQSFSPSCRSCRPPQPPHEGHRTVSSPDSCSALPQLQVSIHVPCSVEQKP